MRVTIRDVAKRSGVSVSTASLALNNKPKVSPETREKVLRAAQELNYHVHHTARNLAVGMTYQIGLFTPVSLEHTFSSSDFFTKLIQGIYNAAQDKGYSLMLFVADEAADVAAQVDRWIRSRSVDGFLITHPSFQMPYLDVLRTNAIPFVFVGRPPETGHTFPISYVDNDNVQVARKATEHLLELGHRRILFINGPARFTYAQDRLQGYQDALQQYDVSLDPGLVKAAELTFVDAHHVTEQTLEEQDFTAIVVLNAMQALGSIQALAKHGLSVPQDISIVASNSALTAYIHPPLTTVDIFPYQLGFQAVQLLQRQIVEDAIDHAIVPCQLIPRSSTVALH